MAARLFFRFLKRPRRIRDSPSFLYNGNSGLFPWG